MGGGRAEFLNEENGENICENLLYGDAPIDSCNSGCVVGACLSLRQIASERRRGKNKLRCGKTTLLFVKNELEENRKNSHGSVSYPVIRFAAATTHSTGGFPDGCEPCAACLFSMSFFVANIICVPFFV